MWWRIGERPRPASVPLPVAADLARRAFPEPDFADAWRIPRTRGLPTDPETWAEAVFGRRPCWVDVLLRLRNEAVRVVGSDRGHERSFAEVARIHPAVVRAMLARARRELARAAATEVHAAL